MADVGAVVPRRWTGSTVVCLGGGPSLTADDVAYCRGKAAVIAINDAYRLAPWADVLYACDAKWWDWHQGVPGFTGLKFALQDEAAQWPGVTVLRNTGAHGLEHDPGGLRTGKNSGYQAINVAVHMGATRIVLLGYDMQAPAHGPSHWFGEHPNRVRSTYAMFLAAFPALAAPLQALGISVINCSRETALDVFPRQPLAEVLA